MERLCWWPEKEETPPNLSALTPARLRAYLSYARVASRNGHHARAPRSTREARPATVATYFRVVRSFANFCVDEGLLGETRLKNVRSPRIPQEQVQPFARPGTGARGRGPAGTCAAVDVAMILILVDTGMRVSDLCSLTVGEVDRGSAELLVRGKRNKRWCVYMGSRARRALRRYLERPAGGLSEEPLFVSVGGHETGGPMTPRGVRQILKKAGAKAGIRGVRIGPHTLRHTFGVSFLRSAGNLFELQQLLGHTDLSVSLRYVALAETNVTQAHRAASRADRLRLK